MHMDNQRLVRLLNARTRRKQQCNYAKSVVEYLSDQVGRITKRLQKLWGRV